MATRSQWNTDPEYIELINFLIERTKDVESPMSIRALAREFKEKSGCSQEFHCIKNRIQILREKVVESYTIDSVTKVKMIFGLGVPVDENFVKGIQENAEVEVDGKNRITRYRAKDGSLELIGDHSHSAKTKEGWKHKKMRSQEDSILKTPESTKRLAPELLSSSKWARSCPPARFENSENYAPDGSIGSPNSSGSKAEVTFPSNTSNSGIQLLRQPKLERDPEAPWSPETSGASPRREAPIFRSGGTPRASAAPLRLKSEENKASNPPEANEAYTPLSKFLESIQFLILILDTTTVTTLQERIKKKLRELSSDEKIATDEMSFAMGLIVAKLITHTVPELSENVESVRFSYFLCYLKAAVMYSRLEGLDVLMKNINKIVEEPGSDKVCRG